MGRANKHSLRMDADFTEDTVGFALESLLTLLSFPRYRFSIEPFSRARERWLGADARLLGKLKSFKPFYMQFKRPSAYPDYSSSRIISDRQFLCLSTSPRALYFDLRQKTTTQNDYQHNILFRLRSRLVRYGIGDAAYICPLFLDRTAYRFHLQVAGLRLWPAFWRLAPWNRNDIVINSLTGEMAFSSFPVLSEHVSIPPHTKVTDAKHKYSFTEEGTDLCFHSPVALPDGSRNCAEFLRRVVGDVGSDAGYVEVDTAFDQLTKLFSQDQDDESMLPRDFPQDQDGIQAWLSWGEHLKSDYQIEQFALMRWRD